MGRAALYAFLLMALCCAGAGAQTPPSGPYIPPGVPIPPGTRVYMLPAAEPADLRKALETQQLVYTVVPAPEMPPWAPIAYYAAPASADPQARVIVSEAYAGVLVPSQHMPAKVRDALITAAALDVMDSGAAGPGWKMSYMLNRTMDAASCQTSCANPYAARESAIPPILGELSKAALKLPGALSSPAPSATP